MKITEKVSTMLENGWRIHDYYDINLTNAGAEVKVPIGLQPGQICREVDGLFLVYVGDEN